RHTRCYRDWSSDVCSSDLIHTKSVRKAHWARVAGRPSRRTRRRPVKRRAKPPRKKNDHSAHAAGQKTTGVDSAAPTQRSFVCGRSEERRVGKEWRPGRQTE